MHIISAPKKIKQEDYCKFEANLGYTEVTGLAKVT